jgi:hypothetical protein
MSAQTKLTLESRSRRLVRSAWQDFADLDVLEHE